VPRLALVLLLCVASHAPSYAQVTASRSIAVRADSLMRDLAERGLFQGAVVVGRGDQIVYEGGFGYADVEQRIPFTSSTPTDAASMAKTFTAAALLTLVAEGRVALDARVRDLLPAYPHAATRVRHLLSHSAGLPGYEWLDSRVAAGQPRTNASHLALVSRDAPMPAFVPGSAFSYDNVAYDVAAMVVERVSGASYPDVLAERFFRPLGLTAFVRPARFADWPGNRTRGYRRTNDGMAAHDAYDLEGFHGAANVYLSARDLHKWLAGYRRVVPPQALRNARRPARLDDGRTSGISLGSWYLSPDTKRRYYTGHHNGFFSVAYADDARDLTVAWVANDAPPAWLQPALARALIAIAEGRSPETLAPPPVSDAVTDITGTYRVSTQGEVRVRRDGERLIVRVRGVPYDAFAVGGDTHYVPGLDAYLRFGTSASGVRALRWDSIYAVEPSVPRRAPR